MKIRSLLYHDVLPDGGASELSGFTGASAFSYKLDIGHFEKHLATVAEAVKRSGSHVSTITEALRTKDDGCVLITFDDGGESALTLAAPALEAHGWRGHFFVATDFIGKPGFLTEDQIRELDARGHVIGSHSCSHPLRMAELSAADLRREWKDSIARLSSVLGRKMELASVPGGIYSSAVGKAASDVGVKILFTSEPDQRVARIGDTTLVGRYSIVREDSPEYAARFASGECLWLYRKQLVLWNAKKIFKRLSGRTYFWVREHYFRARGQS